MTLPLIWQDWVLTLGSLVFFIALIPSILSKDKPDIKTSMPTALVMTAFTITYGSLGLWYGMSTSALTTIAWYILWFQKIRKNKLLI